MSPRHEEQEGVRHKFRWVYTDQPRIAKTACGLAEEYRLANWEWFWLHVTCERCNVYRPSGQ